MNHRLHLNFEQLEKATEQLLRMAENLGSRAYEAPAPGQWSAAHVVHHLMASEMGIGQYLQHKLTEQDKLRPGRLAASLRSGMLRLLLRLPGFKFKAPGRVAALTPTDAQELPSLADMRRQWSASRRRLERLLNEYPSHLTNRAIFKHPRVGMMTMQQTLNFMLDHVLHHRQQLARISKALESVTGASVTARS